MLPRLLLILLSLLFAMSPAEAKRVALVVGNSNYKSFNVLPNPVNDARLMEKALRESGFEVTLILDADQSQMKRAILDFGRTLRKGVDASMFFYAGHGVQVKGENYLIPIDADLESEDEVGVQTIDVNAFLETMESAKSPFNIIVLDACRNNPLRAHRGGGGGLAPVTAPKGSFVAYSTAPGKVALDGDGIADSPYTLALAQTLVIPGMKLEDVFKKTRELVLESTAGEQLPFESTSITGDFYFRDAPAVEQAVLVTPVIPSVDPLAADFDLARSLNSKAGWDLFLSRHGTASDMRVDVAKQESDKLDVPFQKLLFPVAGVIVKWEIFFKFTTQCENDHYAYVVSPAGRKINVMVRGLHRCSGKSETWESTNTNDGGNFVGTEAKGEWKFQMIDLDRNNFSGTLDEVWMELSVKKNGKIVQQKISLGGLPAPIPHGIIK